MMQGAIWVDLLCSKPEGPGSRGLSGPGAGARRSKGQRRVVAGVATVAIASVLLSGCAGSPPAPEQTFAEYTPTFTPTPTPTVDPNGEPVLTAPVRPPEMESPNEAGAIAAARYFMALGSYAMRTGDLEEWRTVSGQTCGFCDNTRLLIEETYGVGHRLTGLAMEVDEARVLGVDEELAVYGVELHYVVAPGAEVDETGTQIQSFESQDAYIIIDVIPSYRGWVLLGGDARDGRAP